MAERDLPGDEKLLLHIDRFYRHATFTQLNLQGKLLVIGPAESMIDMFPILPHFDFISGIDIVSREFSEGVLKERALPFLENEIPLTCFGHTKFDQLTTTYDSAVFFGAPGYITYNGMHLEIAERLNQSGIAYFTVEAKSIEVPPDYHKAKIEVVKNIPPHPTYGDGFSGLIIRKN